MRQEEITFTGSDGQKNTVMFSADYERGVMVYVSDMKQVFYSNIEGIEGYIERMHRENEAVYLREDIQDPQDPDFEVVPVSVLIDAVYSMPDPDKCTLFNWLEAMERRLVRVW